MVHKKSVPNKPGFPLSTLNSTKNQFLKKTGFPLSALIILDWSNVDLLLFKKKAEKIESWSIEFAWQSQSVLPSPVEIGRN